MKLGENAQMIFAEVAASTDLFKVALNVLQGAFRFGAALILAVGVVAGGATGLVAKAVSAYRRWRD